MAVALGLGLCAAPGAVAAPRPPPAAPATVSDAIAGFTFVVGWASLKPRNRWCGSAPRHDGVDEPRPISHSVAFDAMPQALYLKQPGDKGSMTFTEAGYYTCRCAEHPEFPA